MSADFLSNNQDQAGNAGGGSDAARGRQIGSWPTKGHRLQRTAKLAIEVATAGIQPIEVVLSVMRHAWEQQDYKTAAAMAQIALPYTTPRLAATTVTQRDALDDLTPEQLERLIAALERATGGPVITCGSKEGAQSLGDADRNSVNSTTPALHPTLAVAS